MGDLTRNDIFRDGPPLAEATKRNVIFGLSTIPGSGVTTKLAAGFILSALMLHLLSQPAVARGIAYALAIDEAHRVGDLKATLGMAREGRGHGLALMVATQQPDLGDVIGTNAATRVCFGLPDATVAAAAAKRLDRSQPRLADRIRTLPEGYAFARLGAGSLQLLRMAQFYRDRRVVLALPSSPEPSAPTRNEQRP
jgi:hypothetical protein